MWVEEVLVVEMMSRKLKGKRQRDGDMFEQSRTKRIGSLIVDNVETRGEKSKMTIF